MSVAKSVAQSVARAVAASVGVSGGAGGGAGGGLVLDTYSALAGYSTQQRKAAASQAIRVRRSSDNAEQDILANAYSSGLTAFCGAGNGLVATWYDQTTNGRNLTQATVLSQPRVYNAGVVDDGLVFSGQFLSGGQIANFLATSPFTICAWIYQTSNLASASIVCKQSMSSPFPGYQLALGVDGGASGRLGITIRGGGSQISREVTTAVTLNTWTHVAVAYSGGNSPSSISLYLNGSLAAMTAGTGTTAGDATTTADFQVGARDGANQAFAGNIDDVFLFDTALGDAAIASIYGATL